MTHNLKIVPEFFSLIVSGQKTCEVRYNDREYREGDILLLREYDYWNRSYTGRSILCRVTHILDSPVYCKHGFVVMSIKLI